MRGILLLIGVVAVITSKSQQPVWQQNESFVDSLIYMYRTKSKCSLTGSNVKREKKKRRLDIRLIGFLDQLYFGELNHLHIERILQNKFRQPPWRFDESRNIDSFHIYRGRVRSYGNLEPFITYVVLNNEVVGTHVSFRIRSTLDCLQSNDREIPDLLYLASLIPLQINFPFEVAGWTEYFDSKVWIREGVPIALQHRIRRLIGTSSTVSLY